MYRAWDPGIERRVAIKTLEPDLVPENEREEVVERFRRETKIVGQLENPAIVTVFDYGFERSVAGDGGAIYYYVMELLEGRSLADVLRNDGPLPADAAADVARSVAQALALTHRAGVIHRDVKPSNIFLRKRGGAVLLDFGIAKSDRAGITRLGQILGTPSYLAPERLNEKDVPIDGRADLFSLGVLLYTMISGATPFGGDDIYDIIDKISKESHRRFSAPRAKALNGILDRLLAKRPEDRYQSADEVVEALNRVISTLRLDAFIEESATTQSRGASSVGKQPLPDDLPEEASRGPRSTPSGLAAVLPQRGTEVSLSESPEATGRVLWMQPSSDSRPVDESDEDAPTLLGPYPVQPGPMDAPREGDLIEGAAHADDDAAETIAALPGEMPGRAASEARGPPSPPPPPPRTAVRPARGRIEVSLVDEDDVVVRPAPLTREDNEGVPTEAVLSPAETVGLRASVSMPSDDSGVTETGASFYLPVPNRGRLRLYDGEGRRSDSDRHGAAVARRTFGVPADRRRSPARRSPRGNGSLSRGARGSGWRPVFRLALLLGAVVASVAVGLALGRWSGQGLRARSPTPALTREEPVAALAVLRADRAHDQTARSLISDAEAARTAGDLERAQQLYTEAAQRPGSEAALVARARLGKADVLRGLGDDQAARDAYRSVLESTQEGPSALQARAALMELRPPPKVSSVVASSARGSKSEPRASAEASTKPEVACREILFRYASSPDQALAAFETLARDYPSAPCARWNLAVKYERVGEYERAARAYERYLRLVPNSPRKAAVRRRIKRLKERLP